MSITTLLILALLAFCVWAIWAVIVAPEIPSEIETREMANERVRTIVAATKPMPLDAAYVRGVQAATRHIRAGSIE